MKRLDQTTAQLRAAVWVARLSVCCAILGCQIEQVVVRILFSGWIMPLCAPDVSVWNGIRQHMSTWIEQPHTILYYTAENQLAFSRRETATDVMILRQDSSHAVQPVILIRHMN